MISAEPIAPGPEALAETKTYLRIGHGQEDEMLERLLASAAALCEQFTGQAIFARGFIETLPASQAWTRLAQVPVRSIESVEMLADGAAVPVSAEGYGLDVDAAACG